MGMQSYVHSGQSSLNFCIGSEIAQIIKVSLNKPGIFRDKTITDLDPFDTTGCIGNSSVTDLVTLFLQRDHVILPVLDCILRRNVRLGEFVRSRDITVIKISDEMDAG